MQNTRKLILLVAAAVMLATGSAKASHIISTDFSIKINGTNDWTKLDSITGLTDPTFNLMVGESLTFRFGVFGSSGTNIYSFFTDSGSTLSAPESYSISYGGNGTLANPVYYEFSRSFDTIGTFDGSWSTDFGSSSPDYLRPNGSLVEALRLPFTVNVSNAVEPSAVPEPASVAMLTLGGFGMGLGAWRRKRQAKKTLQAA